MCRVSSLHLQVFHQDWGAGPFFLLDPDLAGKFDSQFFWYKQIWSRYGVNWYILINSKRKGDLKKSKADYYVCWKSDFLFKSDVEIKVMIIFSSCVTTKNRKSRDSFYFAYTMSKKSCSVIKLWKLDKNFLTFSGIQSWGGSTTLCSFYPNPFSFLFKAVFKWDQFHFYN